MADTTATTGASTRTSLPYTRFSRWETRQAVRTGQAADIKIYPEGARDSAGAIATVHVRCGREVSAADHAALIAAAPELLAELQAAHQMIKHALAVMTIAQQAEWGRLNAADKVDGEDGTRAFERLVLLNPLVRGAL